MKFVSLFAGIGGFDLGFEAAGMTCVGQVEIDPKCVEVLERHWPDVPRHDDVVTAKEWADEQGLVGSVDVVCGGFPCQDVSVAGRRAGIAGERSGLFWDAIAFASHVEAEWIVLENVPGLLSSNKGRDFGVVLSELADAGYRYIEWRVLDSQFFGVAQRRRRVFLVASSAKRGGRALFVESEGCSGDSPKGGKTGEEVAGTLGGGSSLGGWASDTDRMTFVPYVKARRAQNEDDFETWEERPVAPTLNAFDNASETRATVIAYGQTGFSEYSPNRVTTLVASSAKRPEDNIVVDSSNRSAISFYSTGGGNDAPASEISPSLKVGSASASGPPAVSLLDPVEVRRLTPVECERLQGFPDGWTGHLADTHRYRQTGNAVTVNVAQFVAERILQSDG